MSTENLDKNLNSPETVPPTDISVICDSEAGCVTISKSAIAMIVRKYTLEVEGVSRFAPQRLVEGLADILSKRNYERSIQIDFEDNAAVISLTLIANFGFPLRTVVQSVQSIVKEKIEELVDIPVNKVNIFIKDLEEFVEESAEEAQDLEVIPEI